MQLTSSTLTAGEAIFKHMDNCLIPTGRIGTLHDVNLLNCASDCLKEQACVAFEYFDTNSTCLMGSAYIESDNCTSIGNLYQSSKKDTITNMILIGHVNEYPTLHYFKIPDTLTQ